MLKSRIKNLVALIIVLLSSSSCIKIIRPSEVEGVCKSVKEDWTITYDGVSSTESYDYGDTPSEQSAILMLVKSSFDLFSSSENRSFNLEYSDRFSPVDEAFTYRIPTKMTVTLKNGKLRGNSDALWKVSSAKGNRMVIDNDSGALLEDKPDGSGKIEVQRKCRFVFVKRGGKKR